MYDRIVGKAYVVFTVTVMGIGQSKLWSCMHNTPNFLASLQKLFKMITKCKQLNQGASSIDTHKYGET